MLNAEVIPVYMPVCMFHLQNCATDFDKIWYFIVVCLHSEVVS
jgi:hypothetical protein